MPVYLASNIYIRIIRKIANSIILRQLKKLANYIIFFSLVKTIIIKNIDNDYVIKRMGNNNV